MTVSVVLMACLKWALSHPAELTMAVGALASMLEGPLTKWPFMAKVANLLAQAGVNVPGLKNSAVALFVKEVEAVAEKEVSK